MKKNLVYRHGDMIIVRVDSVNENQTKTITKDASLTLGVGEVSGHSHLVRPLGTATIVEYAAEDQDLTREDIFTDRDELFFEVKGGNAVILHEEHDPHILSEGTYKRWFQISYNPFEQRLQQVKD
jgi:hypothetical protein